MTKDTIHIKASHKGLLTEKARTAGYSSVLEFARYVLAHKDIFHHDTIKEAQFVVNASKFKNK